MRKQINSHFKLLFSTFSQFIIAMNRHKGETFHSFRWNDIFRCCFFFVCFERSALYYFFYRRIVFRFPVMSTPLFFWRWCWLRCVTNIGNILFRLTGEQQQQKRIQETKDWNTTWKNKKKKQTNETSSKIECNGNFMHTFNVSTQIKHKIVKFEMMKNLNKTPNT